MRVDATRRHAYRHAHRHLSLVHKDSKDLSTDPSQPSSYEPDESRAALQALLAENARALDAASERHIADGYERLHELIVTLFAEKDRALSMAADEREKAAQVLREEQHRALGVAESEREKAASALRDALSRSISEGDERLREHIANQVSQIQSALVASELLEVERIKGAHDELVAMIDANTREFRQVQTATKQAVDKAEEAQLRVNAGQNEFRASLSDQAATLMPRRESEAKHESHQAAIRELRDEIGKLRTDLAVGPVGLAPLTTNAARLAGRHESSQAITAALISVVAVIIAATGVIVAILTH